MSFTETEEDKLIKIVSKQPVLYDVRHAEYRNAAAKAIVWETIGNKLNRNSDDCKKKWKFVRDGYKRYKKNMKVGSAAPKNSKDRRHRQLLFLDGVFEQSDSNVSESQEQMNHEEGFDSNQDETKSNEVLPYEYADVKEEQNNESSTDNDEESEPLSLINQSKEKRRKITHYNIERATQSIIPAKREDDVDLFCRHIAEVLRNLPPVYKAEAKKHLSVVLSEYEIKAARNASEASSCLLP